MSDSFAYDVDVPFKASGQQKLCFCQEGNVLRKGMILEIVKCNLLKLVIDCPELLYCIPMEFDIPFDLIKKIVFVSGNFCRMVLAV